MKLLCSFINSFLYHHDYLNIHYDHDSCYQWSWYSIAPPCIHNDTWCEQEDVILFDEIIKLKGIFFLALGTISNASSISISISKFIHLNMLNVILRLNYPSWHRSPLIWRFDLSDKILIEICQQPRIHATFN